jgi:DNA repair exonuclease SbcCD ATPase subunit
MTISDAELATFRGEAQTHEKRIDDAGRLARRSIELIDALEQTRADLTTAQAERDAALEHAHEARFHLEGYHAELAAALERERALLTLLDAGIQHVETYWLSPPRPMPSDSVLGTLRQYREVLTNTVPAPPTPEPEPSEPICSTCGARITGIRQIKGLPVCARCNRPEEPGEPAS